MNTFKRIAVLLAVAILSLCLAACGSAAKKFEGHATLDPAALQSAAEAAVDKARAVKDGSDATADERAELNSVVAGDFAKANDLYRSGDYKGAAETYGKVLETYPLHAGTNVNLTLAMLQQGKTTEALEQALCCVYYFPDDPGCLLNAQVAATACGYGAVDIKTALDFVLVVSDTSTVDEQLHARDSKSMVEYYEYNDIWNQVETDLYKALHSTETGDDDMDPREVYLTLRDRLADVYASGYGGEDASYLLEYLEAVADQLELGAE